MPDSLLGWIMFAFFAGGAAGGWAVLYLVAAEKAREWRGK